MAYLALTVGAFLAILGYVRIAAFIINMAVFRHKHERPYMKWALAGSAIGLASLTVFFVPLVRAVRTDVWSRPGIAGGVWLAFSAAVGAYWIVSRAHYHRQPEPEGAHTIRSEVIPLRKGHIHYPALTKLGLHNDVYDLEITHHRVEVADLPPSFEGFRIAFMSDLHVAGFMRKVLYETCNEEIRKRDCDVVLLGGDFVTWRRHIVLMAERLTRGLTAREGIFAVLGNHDYWSGADETIAVLTARGIRFVHNKAIPIVRNGERIFVGGLDEVYRGEPDVAGLFGAMPDDVPRVVVSHHPDIVDLIGNERIDLLLCGHTHGGQIRAPFFGPILVPSLHEGKYDMGFFRERRLLMYVGRGIGAVPPVRILCRPELAFFDLVRRL